MDAGVHTVRRMSNSKGDPTPLYTIDRNVVMDPVMAEAFLAAVEDPYEALVALMVREGLRPSEAVAVRDSWLTLPRDGWGEVELEHAIVATGEKGAGEEMGTTKTPSSGPTTPTSPDARGAAQPGDDRGPANARASRCGWSTRWRPTSGAAAGSSRRRWPGPAAGEASG